MWWKLVLQLLFKLRKQKQQKLILFTSRKKCFTTEHKKILLRKNLIAKKMHSMTTRWPWQISEMTCLNSELQLILDKQLTRILKTLTQVLTYLVPLTKNPIGTADIDKSHNAKEDPSLKSLLPTGLLADKSLLQFALKRHMKLTGSSISCLFSPCFLPSSCASSRMISPMDSVWVPTHTFSLWPTFSLSVLNSEESNESKTIINILAFKLTNTLW